MTRREIFQKHDNLVARLDRRFRFIREKYADHMQCARGCAQCCHGLFDISLPDALRASQAFGMIPQKIRSAASSRSSAIQDEIVREGRDLQEPFVLNEISGERIDELAESVSGVRCPLLDENDHCLIYEGRPIACRLEGIPMVDSHDGLFGDWCELNFKEGISPALEEDLRLDYYELQSVEQEAAADLSERLLGIRQEDATIFLPSVIAAFDSFWIQWIRHEF
jgi:Fe-S-cluster containining protein